MQRNAKCLVVAATTVIVAIATSQGIAGTEPVYRFWSPTNNAHFYTIDEATKDYVRATWPTGWIYEGMVWNAFSSNSVANLSPVYRLWSVPLAAHYYTIDTAERDTFVANGYINEGIVMYVYAPGDQPAGAEPITQFYNPPYGVYGWFDVDETAYIEAHYPSNIWDKGDVVWYAFNVQINTGSVEVHTSSSYNSVGTDNNSGLTDGQVHFGSADGSGPCAFPDVYIQVEASGGSPYVVDECTYGIYIDSPSSDLEATFIETGANTGVFRIESPIHLADVSDQDNDELGVVDEGTLYVGHVEGVKLDRGEVATISATDVYQSSMNEVADIVEGALGKDEANPCLFWWECGGPRAQTGTTFANFIKNTGSVDAPADLLMSVSHGSGGNLDAYLYAPGISTPTITSTDWDTDIEWAVLYACNLFGSRQVAHDDEDWWFTGGSASAYVTYWDDALICQSGPNHCHGILGSSAPLWHYWPDISRSLGALHMDAFMGLVASNSESVLDAYMDSALDASMSPLEQYSAAALFNLDNTSDRINKVWPETQDTDMYYTWYASVGDSYPQASTFAAEDEIIIGELAKVVCPIPTDQPELAPLLVRNEQVPASMLGSDTFSNRTNWFYGTTLKRKATSSNPMAKTSLTLAEAKTLASEFVSTMAGGLPSDAEVANITQRQVLTYDATDPIATAEAHTHTLYVEFGHDYEGIDIAGGNRGDHIRVAIRDDQVVSVSRSWRTVDGPTDETQTVISAEEALTLATAIIPDLIDVPETGYEITEIKLCYYGLPSDEAAQTLTPAWGIKVSEFLWVYMDAFTGEPLL